MSNALTEVKNQLVALTKTYHELRAKQREINKALGQSTSKLTKEELIQKVWQLPELPENYILDLETNGFRTGSSIYGNSAKAKDIDYCTVTPPHVFMLYTLGYTDTNVEYNSDDLFVTLYGHHHGKLCNIICFYDYELYDAWQQATKILQEMQSTYPSIKQATERKWSRVRLFRAIVDSIFTPKIYSDELSLEDALKYQKCKICHLEAINFSTKAHKEKYLATGICERHSLES